MPITDFLNRLIISAQRKFLIYKTTSSRMALVEDSLLVNKPVICGFMKYGSLKNVSYTVQLLKAYIEIFKNPE